MSETDAVCWVLADDVVRGGLTPERLSGLADTVAAEPLRASLRQAARDLEAGVGLSEALRRAGAVPEAYVLAIGAGEPELVRAMTSAASAERRYLAGARRAAARAVGLLAAVLLGVALGAHIGFPRLEAVVRDAEGALSAGLQASIAGLGLVAGPVGLLLLLGAALAARRHPSWLVWMPRASWLDAPRASALRALAALVEAGMSVERALRAVSGVVSDAGLRAALNRAAQRVEQGVPPASALADSTLVGDLAWSWRPDDEPAAVGITAAAVADVFAARASVSEARLETRARTTYAVLGGALVLWSGLTLAATMWEVAHCLAFV
jgi:type II secretory pathway component PulF